MGFSEIAQFIQSSLIPDVNSMLEVKLATFGSILNRIGFPIIMLAVLVLYLFKNRKNAVDRDCSAVPYLILTVVIVAVCVAFGWIFTNPLVTTLLVIFGGYLSIIVSDNFTKERHSKAQTAMALTNVLVSIFLLVIWVIWLFGGSKNMTWFLLVAVASPMLIYGFGGLKLLSAADPNNKPAKLKNIIFFIIACAALIAAVFYIVKNGLVLV